MTKKDDAYSRALQNRGKSAREQYEAHLAKLNDDDPDGLNFARGIRNGLIISAILLSVAILIGQVIRWLVA